MTVEVMHLGRDRRLVLDAERGRLFERELRRVRREAPHRITEPQLSGPDCRISVTTRGVTRSYDLYAQSILAETAGSGRWLFPLGVQIMIWLNEDTWP